MKVKVETFERKTVSFSENEIGSMVACHRAFKNYCEHFPDDEWAEDVVSKLEHFIRLIDNGH